MNTRSFLKTLANAAMGFAILPPATTYSRIWKATRPPIEEYSCIMVDPPQPYVVDSYMNIINYSLTEGGVWERMERTVDVKVNDDIKDEMVLYYETKFEGKTYSNESV